MAKKSSVLSSPSYYRAQVRALNALALELGEAGQADLKERAVALSDQAAWLSTYAKSGGAPEGSILSLHSQFLTGSRALAKAKEAACFQAKEAPLDLEGLSTKQASKAKQAKARNNEAKAYAVAMKAFLASNPGALIGVGMRSGANPRVTTRVRRHYPLKVSET